MLWYQAHIVLNIGYEPDRILGDWNHGKCFIGPQMSLNMVLFGRIMQLEIR